MTRTSLPEAPVPSASEGPPPSADDLLRPAATMFEMFWKCVLDGGTVDGGDAQDLLSDLGLIEPRACDPSDNEWGADRLYYPTRLGTQLLAAARRRTEVPT